MAVRGRGAFLGEMAAFAPGGARCASVRARGGPVRARVVPGEALRAAVERVPEVRFLLGSAVIELGFQGFAFS